jgi:hypothetical protein
MAARRPRVTKPTSHQTGRTHIVPDRKIHAMKPGMRVSRTGHSYWEARKNRSDKRPKRGL